MGKRSKILQVLLLEDNEYHAELLTDSIESHFPPANVHVTETVEDCQDFILQNKYDIVFSDCFINNKAITNHLLKIKERLGKVPLVMITGSGDEELAAECIKRGADDYIVKSKQSLKSVPSVISKLLNISTTSSSEKQETSANLNKDIKKLTEQAKKVTSKRTGRVKSDIRELDSLMTQIKKLKKMASKLS
ncbi:response regulator [bacterium]|nr:response regulator [bacterium]